MNPDGSTTTTDPTTSTSTDTQQTTQSGAADSTGNFQTTYSTDPPTELEVLQVIEQRMQHIEAAQKDTLTIGTELTFFSLAVIIGLVAFYSFMREGMKW